ncbi:MAG: hypothetical protein R3C26_21880 [Calditrichia bacterium]
MPANITDWVLVELRSTPTGAAVVSKSVLLRNDRAVSVDDDGTTESVTLDAAEGDYYGNCYRNHPGGDEHQCR